MIVQISMQINTAKIQKEKVIMQYVLVFILVITCMRDAISSGDLEIVNIRVGQGDSTLIQGPVKPDGTRVNVLFDAGDIPDRDGGNIIRRVLWKRGVKQLDYLIISHDDADHLGGIAFGGRHGTSLLLGFNNVPGNIGDDDGDGVEDWVTGAPKFDPDPEELGTGDDIKVLNFVDYGEALMRSGVKAIEKYQRFANNMGSRKTINDQDIVNSFEIDLGGGAKMICFAANGYVRGRSARVSNVNTPNERSLSFLVNYEKFDFLISGDLIGRRAGAENARVEEAVGKAIKDAGFQVDVLHVNHHGADNASSVAFLEFIKPEIAVISAGNRNNHEHPNSHALQRLVDAGVDRIFQTSWGTTENEFPLDIRDHQAIWQQDIIVRSNGQHYWIETSRRWESK
jgi:beta-lactamase superfamily II metal-dependent hydrolase